jgi:small subunit ribosomal protein S6
LEKEILIKIKKKKMLNQYETVFIMTPVLSEEQMKETVNKFQKLLTDRGAEIVFSNNWGLRKMAYPIQKKSTGFYHMFEFKANGDILPELDVTYKRDERILRFITVKLDKHAIAYNERKRSGKMAGKTEKAAE